MKKRLLACLLILSLFVTGLGFVPAVQAAEDGISAQWTTKENLAPADQEVMLRPEKGDLSEDSASEITGESNQYQDSDMVTVIVELEDAPLAEAAPTDVKSFAASTQGVALERRGIHPVCERRFRPGVFLHHRPQRLLHEDALR